MSATIKTMLEDLGDAEGAPIPFPNVTAACLKKVIEFCESHHKLPNTPVDDKKKKPKKDDEKKDDIEPWDRDFMAVDQTLLFDLIMVRTLSWLYYLVYWI